MGHSFIGDEENFDIKLLYELLEEFVEIITTKYKNQITSIVLFGSATTSEWIKGRSDLTVSY